MRTNRVSYEVFKGEIPKGLYILHTCDNPRCCNPDHLIAGSPAENVWDAIDKGIMRRKLSWEQVCEIRKEYETVKSYNQISKKYNVDRKTISDIVNFKKRKEK